MKSKVTSDYDLLRKLQSRSSKLESAQELLRTSVRFVLLCKRLDAQMYHAIGPSYRHLAAEEGKPDKQGGGGQQMDTLQESQQETDEDHHEQQQQGAVNVGNLSELAKAAETLKLLEQMLAPPSSSSSSALKAADADAVVGGGGGGGTWEIPLNRLKLVEEKREWIANARGVLTDQMEDLVVRGLKELVSGSFSFPTDTRVRCHLYTTIADVWKVWNLSVSVAAERIVPDGIEPRRVTRAGAGSPRRPDRRGAGTNASGV